MVKIVDETQVEFVCASRIRKLGRAAFLEERDLSIYAYGCKQRGYKAGDEKLGWIAFLARKPHIKRVFCAYLISADVGGDLPVVQGAVPKVKLQPLGTPTKM